MFVRYHHSVLCVALFITCMSQKIENMPQSFYPERLTEENESPLTNELPTAHVDQVAVDRLYNESWRSPTTLSQKDPKNVSLDQYNLMWPEMLRFTKSLPIRKNVGDDDQTDLKFEVGGLRKDLRKPYIKTFRYDGPRKDYFRKTPITRRFNEESECKSVYSCSDCYTARVCRPLENGTFQLVSSIKCPTSAPHCDLETGTCRWQASPQCLNPDNFICLSDGHFPDVDCKFYNICHNLTSERRQCEYEYEYYNADRGECDAETKYCGFFDCFQQTPGTKTPYTTFPNYFAYCDGKKDPLTIDRCPTGTWLNITSQACEPMCSEREGVIEDPVDCTKYYKCSKLWVTKTEWSMIKERKDCPRGTGYDPKNFLCVGLEELPSCHAKSMLRPITLNQIPHQIDKGNQWMDVAGGRLSLQVTTENEFSNPNMLPPVTLNQIPHQTDEGNQWMDTVGGKRSLQVTKDNEI